MDLLGGGGGLICEAWTGSVCSTPWVTSLLERSHIPCISLPAHLQRVKSLPEWETKPPSKRVKYTLVLSPCFPCLFPSRHTHILPCWHITTPPQDLILNTFHINTFDGQNDGLLGQLPNNTVTCQTLPRQQVLGGATQLGNAYTIKN